jgi:ABC-type Na+ efflux pump permease subunit
MNWRAIRTIVVKDLKVVFQSKAVLIPLLVVPVIFMLLMPLGMGVALSSVDPTLAEGENLLLDDLRDDLSIFFDNVPPSLRAELDTLDNEIQRITYLLFVYLLAPLFLVIPMMVANVIAADSFVGEKERKTLEALLYSPTTDRDLYVAKLLTPWLAAGAISTFGFVVYALTVNIATWPVMGQVYLPTVTWLLLVFWVAPAAAGVGLGAIVLISSRTSTMQEAMQVGGIIVVPVVLLVLGQVAGLLYFDVAVVAALGAVLWMIVLAIIWYGLRIFNRGELLSRL